MGLGVQMCVASELTTKTKKQIKSFYLLVDCKGFSTSPKKANQRCTHTITQMQRQTTPLHEGVSPPLHDVRATLHHYMM